MKKLVVVSVSVLSLGLFAAPGFCATVKAGKLDGKALFTQHCASCHPNGGNIVNPKKTLSKKDLSANGIRTARDIVGKMRKPGPGMTHFDAKAIPDPQATAIANYVLTTYNK